MGNGFSQIGKIFGGRTLRFRLLVLTVVLVLLTSIVLLIWKNTAGSSSASSASLGLQVRRDGTEFLVSWDRSAHDIVAAKDAGLVIWDDSRPGSNGKSEPLSVHLEASQLQLGSLMYRSLSLAQNVKFRLEVKNASGSSVSESIVSSAASSAADSGPLHPRAATAHNASRSQLAFDGKESQGKSGTRRIFVPPKPRTESNATGAVMIAPPEIPAPSTPPPGIDPASLQQSDTTPRKPARQSDEGLITITSDPSGANVEINSVPAGVTPLTLQVKPLGLGFTVTVSKDGFETWTVQIVSTPQPYAMHAQLRLAFK